MVGVVGCVGVVGAATVKVTESVGLVLPAGSVCVAETVCWPGGSVTVEEHDHAAVARHHGGAQQGRPLGHRDGRTRTHRCR